MKLDLLQTCSGEGTAALDLPLVREDLVQGQVLCNLSSIAATLDILLVGKHKKTSMLQVLMQNNVEQFHLCQDQILLVIAVNHEDDRIGIRKICRPVGAQTLLAGKVPDLEGDVFMFHLFHIASNGWLRHDNLAKMQVVKDCGLAGIVQTHNDNLALLVA